MRKNIVFCGGGSGGHVLPALSLIKKIRETVPTAEIVCIGSYEGIESRLLSSFNYTGISTGKLRRYFSLENMLDFFKVIYGVGQAYLKLFSFDRRDTVIISTGGFVTIPVVLAGWLQGKPILLHEQTTRAGLANRITSFFADRCLLTFKESLPFFPLEKSKFVGYPFREEVFQPAPNISIKGKLLGEIDRPILFLTGGGNGSKLLNDSLYELLPFLSQEFFIVHQCGHNFYKDLVKDETETYKVFDFVGDEMIALMKKSSVIISRSGAGTVCELVALGKPSIFIPLKIAQKNEQFHNAVAARDLLGSIVIEEEELTQNALLKAIEEIQRKPSLPLLKKNPIDLILEEISNI